MRTYEQSRENLENILTKGKNIIKIINYSFLGLLPEQKYIASKIEGYDRMKAAKISGLAQAGASFVGAFLVPEIWMAPIALVSSAEGLFRGIASQGTEDDLREAIQHLQQTPPSERVYVAKHLPFSPPTLDEATRRKYEDISNSMYMNHTAWLYSHGTPMLGAPYALAKKVVTTLYDVGHDLANVVSSKISSHKDK